MQAIIKIANAQNISNQALNVRDKQALIHQITILAIVNGAIKELAQCRLYMSNSRSSSRITAILWVYGDNYARGSGHADGHGYHKPSAAVGNAIDAAGFELDRHFIGGGGGESVLIDALKAVALAAWPDVDESTLYICEAHN